MLTTASSPARRPGTRARLGLIASVSILGLALVVPAQAATSSTPGLYRGVVNITSTLASGSGTAYGTGMRIAPGVVLTNNHVIEGASVIAITDVVTKRRYRATVAGYDV